MDTDAPAKRSPVPLLAGPYGHPFHPIAVTIPIGTWIASLVFDIGAQASASRADALAEGARWLIAIGIIGAVIAAAIGALDLLTIPRRTPAMRIGLMHAGLNVVVLAGFVVDFFWHRNASSTAVGPIILTAVCLALLGISGSLGGMLAYRFGVRVVDERTQTSGFVRADAGPTASPRA